MNRASSSRGLLVRGAAWSLGGKVAGAVGKAFAIVYVARLLGPDQFGGFTLLISVAIILSLFVDLGISGGTARLLAESDYSVRAILKSAGRVLSAVGVFITCTILIAFDHFTALIGADALSGHALVVALLTAVLAAQKFIRKAFEGIGRVDITGKVGLALEWLPWGCALLLSVAIAPTAGPAVTGKVIGSLLLVIVMAALLWRVSVTLATNEQAMSSGVPATKKVLAYSLPMLATAASFYIYTQSDVILIQMVLDSASVGQYGAVLRLLEALHLPAAAIGSALAARFVTVRREDPALGASIFERITGILMVGYVPLLVLIMWYADEVIKVIYGGAYETAGVLLLLLGPYVVAKAMSATYSLGLDYLGLAGKRAKVITVSALLNLVLTILLLNILGLPGAAIATLISYLPVVWWYYASMRSEMGARSSVLRRQAVTVCAGAVAMAVTLLLLRYIFDAPLFVTASMGLVSYSFVLWGSGMLNQLTGVSKVNDVQLR